MTQIFDYKRIAEAGERKTNNPIKYRDKSELGPLQKSYGHRLHGTYNPDY